ncbi:MAG: hypothetical protein RLN81_07490 [Balneolaceae bacterium]
MPLKLSRYTVITRMKFNLKILFILTLCVVGCNHTQNQPFEKVLGEWKSIKLAGNDIGDFIKEINFSFLTDSSHIGTAFMADSTIDVKKGTFDIKSDSLILIVNDNVIAMKYSFSRDTLIIYDTSIDSQVYLLKKEN